MHRVVPELIVENYRAEKFGGEFPSVGMFLDLSGFSTMTDTLMQHGQHGAEVLATLMHAVFDPLVRNIFEYGGRIVSFAGDGIMALYPVVNGDEKLTALRALASAWNIQDQLLSYPERQTVYGKFSFSVKIGLGVGSVSWRILRSVGGRQATYYFRGSAVDLASDAEHHAGAGQIILTNGIKKLLAGQIETHPHKPFYRFERFIVDMPGRMSYVPPSLDVGTSRVFMPEDVIVHDMRGEFRQIVNLFMRIPDLTDDKLEDFMDVVFKLRNQYGGLLTRIDFGDKGCNILMLWGAPIAYENDINRALNFILDLKAKVTIPLTAGVTYYIAHAGYLGSEMCEDYTCYGWGVNLASRFMMNAPEGEIWADERIEHRVSHLFDFDYVGSQHFKGFAAEQKVNVLRGRKQEDDAIYQGEMVGRQFELERLSKFVEPLWRGSYAGIIAVSGDAGIGKGMLVHAFNRSDLFKQHDATWALCRVDQILRQSFSPIRKWLLRYFNLSSNQTDEEQKQAFDLKMDELIASVSDPELARELKRTSSILGALVDIYWDGSLFNQLDAEGRYNNTFLALIALVKAESLRQPFVLFVDDMHVIDEDSKKFLIQLKRSLSSAPDSFPVAIVLTYRKQGFQPLQDELPDSEIALAGISRLEVLRLAESLLDGPASTELIDLVLTRSEGNPFFAQQVIRYLQDESLLQMSETGWKYVKRGSSSVLPGDIRALLIARLDQLRQEVKYAVQTASVLGREFEVRALALMLGPERDTDGYVFEAEKAAVWMPLQEVRYIFHHGLLRDAAYTMQMHARRSELHALAVSALEQIHADDLQSHYAELAFHAEHAGLLEEAREYYLSAGRFSSELFRNNRALDYLTRALSYVPFNDLEGHFDVLTERIQIHNRLGDRMSQSRDIEAVEKIADQLNKDTYHARVAVHYSNYYYVTGDLVKSLDASRRAIEMSRLLGDPNIALSVYNQSAGALMRMGKLEEAMEESQACLQLARQVGGRIFEGKIITLMGLIALEMKEPFRAQDYFQEAINIARELNERTLESRSLNNMGNCFAYVQRDYYQALNYYKQAYAIMEEIGDRYGLGLELANLGWLYGLLGDFLTARKYHEQALIVAREVGNTYQETFTLLNLSGVAEIQRVEDDAVKFARLAVDMTENESDKVAKAWAHLYMGNAYALTGEYAMAREGFQRSLDLRREMGQHTFATEPLAGLINLALQENNLTLAGQLAEEIMQYLSGGGSLEGIEEPLRVYHACYNALEIIKDPRSGEILHKAYLLLEEQVSKLKDETSRRMYIDNVPWRKAIKDAWQVASNSG